MDLKRFWSDNGAWSFKKIRLVGSINAWVFWAKLITHAANAIFLRSPRPPNIAGNAIEAAARKDSDGEKRYIKSAHLANFCKELDKFRRALADGRGWADLLKSPPKSIALQEEVLIGFAPCAKTRANSERWGWRYAFFSFIGEIDRG